MPSATFKVGGGERPASRRPREDLARAGRRSAPRCCVPASNGSPRGWHSFGGQSSVALHGLMR